MKLSNQPVRQQPARGFSTDTVIRQIRAGYIKAFTLSCKPSVLRRVYRWCYRVQGSEIAAMCKST
jgi:hypothetical protein